MANSSARQLIAWLVAGSYFMELLDGTVIATALPQIARSFHVSAIDLNVGMTAYLLTLGVFIPLSGWVADRYGARSVFGSAILLFTLSSVLCGLSHGLLSFTGARILQGIGGAMMTPVGRLVVLRTTDKKDLLRVMALIIWPGLLAPVLGPGLGGLVTTYFSWRWIFFLNAPLGAVALALNFLLVPNLQSESRRPLDGVGFLLSGGAIVCIVYGIEVIGHENASPWTSAALIAGGAAAGALALWHMKRTSAPLLEFEALRRKTYSANIWGGSLFRIMISTAPFLLPLMFQISFGLDALSSGLLVMAVFIGNIAIKPATTPIVRRFGFRGTLIVNGLLVAATLCACGLLFPSTPIAVVLVVLLAGGACRSLQFTASSTMQFADVPESEMSGANTLSSMVSQVTSGIGVAVGALAVDVSCWVQGHPLGAPTLADFHAAFFLIGALSLLSTFDWKGLKHDAGSVVSGHRRRSDPEPAG